MQLLNNKMKKFIIPIIASIFLLPSCNKWLDVKPEDKFIEEEVLKTPKGFEESLNGIYLKLGSNDLYGNNLNLKYLDMLAQLYRVTPEHGKDIQQLVAYNYGADETKVILDNIWSNIYVNITNINRFLENLETYGSVLDTESRSIMIAEGHALRAYLYFDLLRMFAPNYVKEPNAATIPYYDKTGYESAPYASSSVIMEKINADLLIAEKLLEQYDPAIKLEKVDQTYGTRELGNKPFLQFRNYHLNYFAVKGLQARVYLYQGKKTDALQAAQTVIANKSKFPWITSSQLTGKSSANRVFSTELLFAFENPKLYSVFENQFSGALEDKQILSAGTNDNFLNAIYDSWANDFRYGVIWDLTSGKSYRVFTKYKDLTLTEKGQYNYRFTVPGIRLSEVFLIAAECTTNPAQSLTYLNELRTNRNCDVLGSNADITANIMKEYRKEFYGEGQLWYFYKRTNATSILSASNNSQKTISYTQYTFPLPLSETQPR